MLEETTSTANDKTERNNKPHVKVKM